MIGTFDVNFLDDMDYSYEEIFLLQNNLQRNFFFRKWLCFEGKKIYFLKGFHFGKNMG